MITGTLMSSANWIPRPKLFIEDESSLMPTASAITSNKDKDNKDSNNNTASSATTATTTAVVSTNETNLRSAALERAYVHDVYENCEEPVGPIRPKVAQFLTNLDAGSLVCDVGCGNGRYLTAACNPAIYSIGVDRCYRLAKVSRSRGGEVAICDNLDLPFRDESFDAVLSLAVVHHFATTERRVNAIRELARILRIGGRVIITVWALEQKSRRFESQDVLVPWQQPKSKNNITSDDEDDDDFLPPYNAYTYTEDSTNSNSSRSAGDGDSSSLSSSSPSDTCYSFVRRALQKLAGGKKSPWFLDSWNSKDTKNDSSLDYEDAKDLPIELRRLEDFDDIPEPLSSAGLKSRSLGSILYPPPKQIVRSRSSVPSLGAQIPEMKQSQIVEPLAHSSVTSTVLSTSSNTNAQGTSTTTPSSSSPAASRRPKLIKQKQSLCDDVDYKFDESSPYKNMSHNETRTQLLRKQSSLNEELMAESRIREKERIRKRIQKQMSLNESFLCRSVFTKRLQVIREGFTTKLKTSTGSLERVTKSGLVKIMQNLKSASTTSQCPSPDSNATTPPKESKTMKNGPVIRKLSNGNCNERSSSTSSSVINGEENEKIRRHSRESGSDSSKDSSLQSDTSIESEDSFASVIFIPKKPDQSNKMPSVPTSPLIMPCPTPVHSPAPIATRCNQPAKEATRFTFEDAQQIDKTQQQQEQKKFNAKKISTTVTMNNSSPTSKISTIITPPTPIPAFAVTKSNTINTSFLSSKLMPKITRQTIKDLPPIPKFRKLHKLSSFPVVRRISATNVTVPKLMSLELFNPETDDLDSDSSEPSSPDSIDSVINALQQPTTSSTSPCEPLLSGENTTNSITTPPTNEPISNNSNSVAPIADITADVADELENTVSLVANEQELTTVISDGNSHSFDSNDDEPQLFLNKNDINLNVNINHNNLNNNNVNLKTIISDNDENSDNLDNFSCRQNLVEFAEQLSAQLLLELDDTIAPGDEIDFGSYANDNKLLNNDTGSFDKLLMDNLIDDPYLKKINGDIKNLNQLRDELRERRLMLANLSTKPIPQQESKSPESPIDSLSYTNTNHTTIQELEEDDSPPLSAKIQSHILNSNLASSMGTPNATKKQLQKINDFIPELDENDEDDKDVFDDDSSSRERLNFNHMSYNATNSNFNNTQDTALLLQEDSFDEIDTSAAAMQQMKHNLLKNSKHANKMNPNDSNNNSNNNSCDSWGNSNSTTASLDSPSVGGGSATHHRYYHVFKEGELDALINKHVANLHIVSSYYERASWCVVCEKVQVWTI